MDRVKGAKRIDSVFNPLISHTCERGWIFIDVLDIYLLIFIDVLGTLSIRPLKPKLIVRPQKRQILVECYTLMVSGRGRGGYVCV